MVSFNSAFSLSSFTFIKRLLRAGVPQGRGGESQLVSDRCPRAARISDFELQANLWF